MEMSSLWQVLPGSSIIQNKTMKFNKACIQKHFKESSWFAYDKRLPLKYFLTFPMLKLLSSKSQWCKDFRKPSKPCHVGIHWIISCR